MGFVSLRIGSAKGEVADGRMLCIARAHMHDLGLLPCVVEGFDFGTSRIPEGRSRSRIEYVLEPCKPGRGLYARIVGDLLEILSLFDTLEDLYSTPFSTTSDQPFGIWPPEHHPTNVVQTGGHLRDEIQRVIRNCEDRDRVALGGRVVAVRGVQVRDRKLLVCVRDEDLRCKHVAWMGEWVPFRRGRDEESRFRWEGRDFVSSYEARQFQNRVDVITCFLPLEVPPSDLGNG